MSASGSPLYPALSFVAVILAGSAIYIAQQQPVPAPVQTQAAFDPTALEESMSALHQEVMQLQTKIDALDQVVTEKPDTNSEPENEEARIQLRAMEAERITAAVEAVMEERGVDLAQQAQRRAKREAGRTTMSKWVGTSRGKLPNLYDQIAARMELDPRTEMDVEEILETGFETLTIITDELVEGDHDDEEILALQIEAKEEFGNIIEQLDEILDPQQMINLGQIYSQEVDPKVGGAITNAGNQSEGEAEGEN